MVFDGKRVLVTGGTGSLGKAILFRSRQEKWDCKITVVARNETKMNQVRSEYPEVSGEIGDVRDLAWLNTIFPGHNVIIHAAAIKIVPVAEASPREAVLTNVIGSLNVAMAAVNAGVERVVGISTDKSCGPTYYGTTKRLMEGIFRQARSWGNTEFVLCRYGNVLKSANSIIPLFYRLIEEDKPFTITHLEMNRFWLSMKQAIDLILHTYEHAPNGAIFIPKAPAMKLVDVARTLDPDREIIEIGIRPGERLDETLLVKEEAMHTVETNGFFCVYPPEKEVQSNLPFQYEYTTQNAAKYLTSDELLQLIEES